MIHITPTIQSRAQNPFLRALQIGDQRRIFGRTASNSSARNLYVYHERKTYSPHILCRFLCSVDVQRTMREAGANRLVDEDPRTISRVRKRGSSRDSAYMLEYSFQA
jgi:hypothetical protein